MIFKRLFHSTNVTNFFTTCNIQSNLKNLRKNTGYSLVQCRQALQKFNDDIDQATKWLDEQAQKEGWAKADKLKDRAARQGLLAFVKNDAPKLAAVVELNCETDFVAKNEKFQELLSTIATSILSNCKVPSEQQKTVLFKNDLLNIKLANHDSRTIGDELAIGIGNLKENLSLRRAILLNAAQNSTIGWYMHGSITNCVNGVHFGKYAAMVNLKMAKAPDGQIQPFDVGRQISQHIVGMKPKSMGTYEAPKEGEERKFSDSETRLLNQEFLMKSDMSVGDFVKQHGAEIVDFVRMECGETVENEPNAK